MSTLCIGETLGVSTFCIVETLGVSTRCIVKTLGVSTLCIVETLVVNTLWPSSIANFSLETEVVIRMSGRVNDRMRFSLIRLLKVTVY